MKLVKRFLQPIGLTLLAAANLSMLGENHYRLLTQEDRVSEESQEVPALSSAVGEVPHWESFNEWHCFSASEIEPSCVGVVWDQEKAPDQEEPMPSLAVSSSTGTMLFDYEEAHFQGTDCNRVVADWKELLAGERSACVYGAHLQDVDRKTSLWSLFGLKTSKSYWPKNQSEFFSTSSVDKE